MRKQNFCNRALLCPLSCLRALLCRFVLGRIDIYTFQIYSNLLK